MARDADAPCLFYRHLRTADLSCVRRHAAEARRDPLYVGRRVRRGAVVRRLWRLFGRRLYDDGQSLLQAVHSRSGLRLPRANLQVLSGMRRNALMRRDVNSIRWGGNRIEGRTVATTGPILGNRRVRCGPRRSQANRAPPDDNWCSRSSVRRRPSPGTQCGSRRIRSRGSHGNPT